MSRDTPPDPASGLFAGIARRLGTNVRYTHPPAKPEHAEIIERVRQIAAAHNLTHTLLQNGDTLVPVDDGELEFRLDPRELDGKWWVSIWAVLRTGLPTDDAGTRRAVEFVLEENRYYGAKFAGPTKHVPPASPRASWRMVRTPRGPTTRCPWRLTPTPPRDACGGYGPRGCRWPVDNDRVGVASVTLWGADVIKRETFSNGFCFAHSRTQPELGDG